jgi:hypothetical protein
MVNTSSGATRPWPSVTARDDGARGGASDLRYSEQVNRITFLVDLLKIPETKVAQVLSKAGADGFSDLTTEDAAKTLSWLESKMQGVKG